MSIGHRIMRLLNGMMGAHEDAGPTGLRLRALLMKIVPGQLTCSEFEQFVVDYRDGGLGARERQIFESHMELCPMCHVYFDSYVLAIELGQRICAADASAQPAELPDELVSAILAARRAR